MHHGSSGGYYGRGGTGGMFHIKSSHKLNKSIGNCFKLGGNQNLGGAHAHHNSNNSRSNASSTHINTNNIDPINNNNNMNNNNNNMNNNMNNINNNVSTNS